MEAVGDFSEFDATHGSVVRHLNCLQDQNRLTRRRAIEAIQNEIFSGEESKNDGVVCPGSVVEIVIRPLLRAFSDPVEKCRELAILTVGKMTRARRKSRIHGIHGSREFWRLL